jgi:hypothetical protein
MKTYKITFEFSSSDRKEADQVAETLLKTARAIQEIVVQIAVENQETN